MNVFQSLSVPASLQVANLIEEVTFDCCKQTIRREWTSNPWQKAIRNTLKHALFSLQKHICRACYRAHAIITSIPLLNAVNFCSDKGLNETRGSVWCTLHHFTQPVFVKAEQQGAEIANEQMHDFTYIDSTWAT